MKILLNGETCQTFEDTLHLVLVQFGYGDIVVATAVNGEFVAETERARKQIWEGDLIEVLAPMQGG